MSKRATGRADVRGKGYVTVHLVGHQQALENALENWITEYGEPPNWDDIMFHGGHTTTEVIIEMWEER